MQRSIPTPGERLQRARRESGMSQAAVAEQLGVSSTTVGRWERSQRSISDTLLERLRNIYDKPLLWFLSIKYGGLEQASGQLGNERAMPDRPYPVIPERISDKIAGAPADYRPIIKTVVKEILDGLKQGANGHAVTGTG